MSFLLRNVGKYTHWTGDQNDGITKRYHYFKHGWISGSATVQERQDVDKLLTKQAHEIQNSVSVEYGH